MIDRSSYWNPPAPTNRMYGKLNNSIVYVGVAFYPRIVDGYLTWHNEYGLPNPEPYYVKGERGRGVQSVGVNPENNNIVFIFDDGTKAEAEVDLPQIINRHCADDFPRVGKEKAIYLADDGIYKWDAKDEDYIKISGIYTAEDFQADWNEEDETSPHFIRNKPTINEDKHYLHEQKTASDEWIIKHDLHKYPSVSIVDSAGSMVMGDVLYNSPDQVTLRFSAPFSGSAYLN